MCHATWNSAQKDIAMPNWVASCHVDLGQTEETAPAFLGQSARTAVMRAPTNDKKPIIFSLLIIHIYI